MSEPIRTAAELPRAGVLPDFWCLRSYDQRGSLMYAYGPGGPFVENRYPSTIGCVSHRWRDARIFRSEQEARAAIPSLQPWIDAYVLQRRREKTEKRRRGEPPELPFSATPLIPYCERGLIPIYGDGSCSARDIMRRAMDQLRRQEEIIATLRRFVQAWQHLLDGFSWDLSTHTYRTGCPEIKLSTPGFRVYRGEQISVEQIAALWPAEWTRVKPDYPDEGYLQYHWQAELDGVTLIIDRAECTRLTPPTDHGAGTRVRLPRRKESEVRA